jgi:hypothetical protein
LSEKLDSGLRLGRIERGELVLGDSSVHLMASSRSWRRLDGELDGGDVDPVVSGWSVGLSVDSDFIWRLRWRIVSPTWLGR